ncbi:MAG TPA: Rieske (2Fe-2S) protein [Solirubrobacteraceae bacterium]|jgi:nitrite reductase/ring-hydroxylating ferredoxin subunit
MPETVRERLCRSEGIPDGGVRVFPVGRFGVGIFRRGERFTALSNRCPHAGARVCEGWITGTVELAAGEQGKQTMVWARDGEILRCPWHGWEFEIESGRTLTDPSRRIKRYDVHVEEGWLYVEL